MNISRIRAKNFPRGWSFVQGARCVPILLGVPATGYLNLHSDNKKAGYYLSFVFVILGAVTLFFMDFWKGRHHHRHDKYCEGNLNSSDNLIIEPENLSQKLSDVQNSVVGGAGNSLVLSEHESIKEAESLNNNKVTFTMVVPIDEDDQGEDRPD